MLLSAHRLLLSVADRPHCARCPRQQRVSLAEMIARYGEDHNVLALAQMLVTCSRCA